MDGNEWKDVIAEDGDFDENEETFSVSVSAAPGTEHQFDMKARDAAGNWSALASAWLMFSDTGQSIEGSQEETILEPGDEDVSHMNWWVLSLPPAVMMVGLVTALAIARMRWRIAGEGSLPDKSSGQGE